MRSQAAPPDGQGRAPTDITFRQLRHLRPEAADEQIVRGIIRKGLPTKVPPDPKMVSTIAAIIRESRGFDGILTELRDLVERDAEAEVCASTVISALYKLSPREQEDTRKIMEVINSLINCRVPLGMKDVKGIKAALVKGNEELISDVITKLAPSLRTDRKLPKKKGAQSEDLGAEETNT